MGKKFEQNFVAFFNIFIFAALQKKLIKKLIRWILLNNKVKKKKNVCVHTLQKPKTSQITTKTTLEKLHSGLAFFQFSVFACECNS
jgi:hypothetical protein